MESTPTLMRSRTRYQLRLADGRPLVLGERTLVMGILNVTPDSFADGGVSLDPDRAVATAVELETAGADIIDVGGESTRPGARALTVADELDRVLPVLDRLKRRIRVPLSIDTYKAEVARQALDAGASMVNDISGLRYDPDLASVVARSGAPLVLMHTRGRSREMYREARYDDVAGEVRRELADAITRAVGGGVAREQVIVDPGLGFAKRAEHTFAVLAHLGRLAELDQPILVGPSRKSFLQEVLGEQPPAEREWGTAAAVAAAVWLGAHIVRVHGVRAMTQVVRVTDRLRAEAGASTSTPPRGLAVPDQD